MSNVSKQPILLDFPEEFQSDRLIIRAPLWGDGKAVHEAVRDSIDELKPWLPWAQTVPTVEEAEARARLSRLEFLERKDLRLMLVYKESGRMIGGSGLHRINWDARRFEIGYWVHSAFAGQGYVTEAVNAITNYSIRELQANRIEIRCDARNTGSANVAKRAGFTLEGILRSESRSIDGSLCDTMVFAKVRGADF